MDYICDELAIVIDHWRHALSRHKIDDRGRFPRAADSTNYNLYAADAIERPIAGIM